MVLSSKYFVALLAVGALGMGCGAAVPDDSEAREDDVSSEEALSTKITAGEFRLYGEPNATVYPECNSYTQLTLSNKSGARADLREVLEGSCEIMVVPNPRYYRLKSAGTSCGSKTYKGSFKTRDGSHSIVITDHRSRTCRDIVPAKIIVEETSPRGTWTKYSYDAAPSTGAAEGETCGDGTFGMPSVACGTGLVCEYPASTAPVGPDGSSSAVPGTCVKAAGEGETCGDGTFGMPKIACGAGLVCEYPASTAPSGPAGSSSATPGRCAVVK